MSVQLFHGDCLDILPTLEAGSVDMVLADPPYGTTACSWDSVIDLPSMWEGIKRVIKPNGSVVLFGSQPFTSALVMSNPKWFRYCWVWLKSKPNGWQHAPNMPMKTHEDITVFSSAPMGHKSILGNKRMAYFPQGVKPSKTQRVKPVFHGLTMGARPNQVGKEYEALTGFPSSVIKVPNLNGANMLHPTQKPVPLLQYLIRTYTNKGDTVLDFCMGSGSTGVACVLEGRNFIGIEKDTKHGYFEIAKKRIHEAETTPRTMEMELVP